MLTRALIVLLLALNLGVALWWLLRDEPAPPAAPAPPAGVAQLQLVEPAPSPAAPPPAASPLPAAASASAVPAAMPASCARFGPYDDAQALAVAAQRLKERGVETRPHELPGAGASAYSVLIPAQGDRAAADAMAQRIGQAGFDDYLIVGSGAEINSIALGRYRSQATALRRQQALQAAGFPAQLQPVGAAGPSQWWLDARLPPGSDLQVLRPLAASAQAQPLDCAAIG